MNPHLAATPLLDFHSAAIEALVTSKGWRQMTEYDAIGGIYRFVKDEIRFGYNASDDLPASRVLADGYGQCNTKGSLLMALLRATGIPCRFHGFTIFNALQGGAIPQSLMWLAPDRIIHSWVEISYQQRWIALEGFILDTPYLQRVQEAFAGQSGRFLGFGVATCNLADPPVDWCGEDTFIQREGIADDLGIYDCPDDFYRQHGANLTGIKRLMYRYLIRHVINRHVRQIRERGIGRAQQQQTSTLVR